MKRLIVVFVLMMGMVSMGLAEADKQALAAHPLVRWSPDGEWIATVTFEGIVSVTSWASPSQSIELTHNGSISDVAWSPDSTRIGVGLYADRNISIWDVATGSLIKVLQGHKGYDGGGMFLEWNPKQEILATITDDWSRSPIQFWETRTYIQIGMTEVMQTGPDPIKWKSDGTQLAVTAFSHGLLIYDLFRGQNISYKHRIKGLPLPDGLSYIDWSPDGDSIAVVKYETQFVFDEEQHITLYEYDSFKVLLDGITFEEIAQITEAVHGAMHPILWSPDGSRIAILNTDHIDVIDAQTGASLDQMSVETPNYDAVWSPFGGQMAIVGASAEKVFSVQFIVLDPSLELINNIEVVCVPDDVIPQLPDVAIDIDVYIEAVKQNEAIGPGCAADLMAVAEAVQDQN